MALPSLQMGGGRRHKMTGATRQLGTSLWSSMSRRRSGRVTCCPIHIEEGDDETPDVSKAFF
jgi:hypothetical protein